MRTLKRMTSLSFEANDGKKGSLWLGFVAALIVQWEKYWRVLTDLKVA